MTAFTDYPILELGDVGGKMAPIRQVEVLSYDDDKYVTVRVEGVITDFKRGYLYKSPGRLGDVEIYRHEELSHLPLTEID